MNFSNVIRASFPQKRYIVCTSVFLVLFSLFFSHASFGNVQSKLYPVTAAERLQSASQCFIQGNFDQCITLCDKVLEENPKHPKALSLKSMALLHLESKYFNQEKFDRFSRLPNELEKTSASTSSSSGQDSFSQRKSLELKYSKVDPNMAYEYEDQDIDAILFEYMRQTKNDFGNALRIVPAISSLESLREQINAIVSPQSLQEKNGRAQTILIPFDIGNHHWIGLVMRFDVGCQQPSKVFYMDPHTDPYVKEMPKNIREMFISIYGKNIKDKFQPKELLRQFNMLSSGPLTVENLNMFIRGIDECKIIDHEQIKEIREKHADLLRKHKPDLRFDHRQNHNIRSFAYPGISSRIWLTPIKQEKIAEEDKIAIRKIIGLCEDVIVKCKDHPDFILEKANKQYLREISKEVNKISWDIKNNPKYQDIPWGFFDGVFPFIIDWCICMELPEPTIERALIDIVSDQSHGLVALQECFKLILHGDAKSKIQPTLFNRLIGYFYDYRIYSDLSKRLQHINNPQMGMPLRIQKLALLRTLQVAGEYCKNLVFIDSEMKSKVPRKLLMDIRDNLSHLGARQKPIFIDFLRSPIEEDLQQDFQKLLRIMLQIFEEEKRLRNVEMSCTSLTACYEIWEQLKEKDLVKSNMGSDLSKEWSGFSKILQIFGQSNGRQESVKVGAKPNIDDEKNGRLIEDMVNLLMPFPSDYCQTEEFSKKKEQLSKIFMSPGGSSKEFMENLEKRNISLLSTNNYDDIFKRICMWQSSYKEMKKIPSVERRVIEDGIEKEKNKLFMIILGVDNSEIKEFAEKANAILEIKKKQTEIKNCCNKSLKTLRKCDSDSIQKQYAEFKYSIEKIIEARISGSSAQYSEYMEKIFGETTGAKLDKENRYSKDIAQVIDAISMLKNVLGEQYVNYKNLSPYERHKVISDIAGKLKADPVRLYATEYLVSIIGEYFKGINRYHELSYSKEKFIKTRDFLSHYKAPYWIFFEEKYLPFMAKNVFNLLDVGVNELHVGDDYVSELENLLGSCIAEASSLPPPALSLSCSSSSMVGLRSTEEGNAQKSEDNGKERKEKKKKMTKLNSCVHLSVPDGNYNFGKASNDTDPDDQQGHKKQSKPSGFSATSTTIDFKDSNASPGMVHKPVVMPVIGVDSSFSPQSLLSAAGSLFAGLQQTTNKLASLTISQPQMELVPNQAVLRQQIVNLQEQAVNDYANGMLIANPSEGPRMWQGDEWFEMNIERLRTFNGVVVLYTDNFVEGLLRRVATRIFIARSRDGISGTHEGGTPMDFGGGRVNVYFNGRDHYQTYTPPSGTGAIINDDIISGNTTAIPAEDPKSGGLTNVLPDGNCAPRALLQGIAMLQGVHNYIDDSPETLARITELRRLVSDEIRGNPSDINHIRETLIFPNFEATNIIELRDTLNAVPIEITRLRDRIAYLAMQLPQFSDAYNVFLQHQGQLSPAEFINYYVDGLLESIHKPKM